MKRSGLKKIISCVLIFVMCLSFGKFNSYAISLQ